MTYLSFLVIFVALPIALLVSWRSRDLHVRGPVWALVLLVAVPAACLWDHQAALWGMWQWSTRLTLRWRWWSLPIEEIAFILLLIMGVLALCERSRHFPPLSNRPWHAINVLFVLCALVGGVALCAAILVARLPDHAHPMYLPYLMLWSSPLLALQWLVGGRALWHKRHLLMGIALITAVWCTAADALALHVGLWRFAPGDLMGLFLGDVPVEEALFFAVVALLVAQTYFVMVELGWDHLALPQFQSPWVADAQDEASVPHMRHLSLWRRRP